MKLKRIVAAIGLAACASTVFAQDKGAAPKADTTPAPVIMLVPIEISDPAMKAGCWVQMYDERNFKGDVLTLAGPLQIDSADKAAGKQLKKKIDSLVTGPKATLTVFEHNMFKDKSVKFAPNSKEAGLIKKLGFTGHIQSLKLDCGS